MTTTNMKPLPLLDQTTIACLLKCSSKGMMEIALDMAEKEGNFSLPNMILQLTDSSVVSPIKLNLHNHIAFFNRLLKAVGNEAEHEGLVKGWWQRCLDDSRHAAEESKASKGVRIAGLDLSDSAATMRHLLEKKYYGVANILIKEGFDPASASINNVRLTLPVFSSQEGTVAGAQQVTEMSALAFILTHDDYVEPHDVEKFIRARTTTPFDAVPFGVRYEKNGMYVNAVALAAMTYGSSRLTKVVLANLDLSSTAVRDGLNESIDQLTMLARDTVKPLLYNDRMVEGLAEILAFHDNLGVTDATMARFKVVANSRSGNLVHLLAQTLNTEASLDAFKNLHRQGVDIACADSGGWTALHYAILSGNAPLCEFLLTCGLSFDNKQGLAAIKKTTSTTIDAFLQAWSAKKAMSQVLAAARANIEP